MEYTVEPVSFSGDLASEPILQRDLSAYTTLTGRDDTWSVWKIKPEPRTFSSSWRQKRYMTIFPELPRVPVIEYRKLVGRVDELKSHVPKTVKWFQYNLTRSSMTDCMRTNFIRGTQNFKYPLYYIFF